ncbi:MAG: hypothetical protein ABIO79_13555 [Ferruginibacter sp.]
MEDEAGTSLSFYSIIVAVRPATGGVAILLSKYQWGTFIEAKAVKQQL